MDGGDKTVELCETRDMDLKMLEKQIEVIDKKHQFDKLVPSLCLARMFALTGCLRLCKCKNNKMNSLIKIKKYCEKFNDCLKIIKDFKPEKENKIENIFLKKIGKIIADIQALETIEPNTISLTKFDEMYLECFGIIMSVNEMLELL